MLVEKIRKRGILWTISRTASHLWKLVFRRGDSKYSWQLVTGNLPELDLVNIEITTYCNLKCAGCQRTIYAAGDSWDNQHLSVENFKKIVDQLPSAQEIIPQGIGEPTLHPDLPGLIRIARNAKKFNQITITTHGMARDLDYFDELFASGLKKLYVSVDTLDPELVERLRAGTNVEMLKERIRELAKRFPGKIDVRVTVGRENVHDIPALLTELNRLGKYGVVMCPYDDLGDAAGCLSPDEKQHFLASLPDMTRSASGLQVITHGFTASDEICHWPWRSPSITVTGELTPCCRIMYHNEFSFGNVLSRSFDEVWNGDDTEKWRQRFIERSPDICSGCPWFTMRTASCATNVKDGASDLLPVIQDK